MYIKNCWYVACWDYQLVAGSPYAITIADEPIVLYRDSDGGAVALEDRCRHRLAPLSKGRIEGNDLRCLYHGFKYEPSGRCIEIPGQDRVPTSMSVRRYPVLEKHNWVWVWMGDPEKADPALAPGLDLPGADWARRSGHMDYAANYQLINDNLTDFSHLSYVHENSFGVGDEIAKSRPQVTRLDRGIRISRWIIDRAGESGRRPDRPVGTFDRWQTYDYLVPGILPMRGATFPLGTADACEGQPPGPGARPVADNYNAQAVTPMTERATRYFFGLGPRLNDTAERADKAFEVTLKAFAEDKDMIEAQQAMLDRTPGYKMLLTSADRGPQYMRETIEHLAKAEIASA